MNKEEKIMEFIDSIHELINYWDDQKDITSKEKMKGLVLSILCMLDGVSGNYDGNIHKLAKLGKDFMFHDFLCKKEE